MLTIDLSQFNTYFIAALPAIVAAAAGLLRQDKFPRSVNEVISILIVVLIALMQALLGGKLGGSPLADFGIIVAYTMAVLHTPLFQQLQQGVQSNVLSFGKPAPQPAQVAPPVVPQVTIDVSRLAALLIAELGKPNVPMPPPPIESMPTQANLPVVRTNTPAQGG